MNSTIISICILAGLLTVGSCDGNYEVTIDVSDVITLDQSNFAKSIQNYPVAMVMFYASWCPHSQKLEPEYEIAASILKDENVTFAKVDASTPENEPLAVEFEIDSYPTLILFQNGGNIPYKGVRTSHGVVDFVRKQLGPAIKLLESYDDYELLIKRSSITVIGMFTADCALESRAFNVVAEVMRDEFTFAVVEEDNLKLQLSEDGDIYQEEIIMVRHFEPKVIHYNVEELTATVTGDEGTIAEDIGLEARDYQELNFNAREAQNLTHWIRSNSFPPVAEIDQSNFERYIERGLPMVWLTVDLYGSNKHHYRSVFEAVAMNHLNRLSFVVVDGNKHEAQLEQYGVAVLPAILIQDESDRYVLDEELPITEEEIEKFISQYLNDELEPTWKSESVPSESFDENGIEVLVSRNFEEKVMQSGRDYFIQFYAPWCVQCQEMDETWKILSQQMSRDRDSVRIARFNGSENDVPVRDFPKIQGFPSLLFVPGNDPHHPIEFIDRKKALSEFSTFLREHSQGKYKVPMSSGEILDTVREMQTFIPAADEVSHNNEDVSAKLAAVREQIEKLVEQLQTLH